MKRGLGSELLSSDEPFARFVTPRSCSKGFEDYSFGQKKRPSPWATARICGLLRAGR